MNAALCLVAAVLTVSGIHASASDFDKDLSPRLIFEPNRDKPQLLEVYLHLENTGDQDANWTANGVADLEASLTDADGHPAPAPGFTAADIASSRLTFGLPVGSRMDWRLSYHFGISTVAPKPNEYQIQLGTSVWNVPKDKIGTYVIKIRLSGWTGIMPDNTNQAYLKARERVLFDLPPQKIVISHLSHD